MRFGAKPDDFFERMALAANMVPTPLVDTQLAYSLARTVMVAAKLGVFEALARGHSDVEALARVCDADHLGMEKLVNALVGARYVVISDDGYVLEPRLTKWLDPDSPTSLHDKLLCQLEFEWELVGLYEDFVRTGRSADMHESLNDDEWSAYQRGMKAIASLSAGEVGMRTPVPRNAEAMLDIGGSHGMYSAAICRNHDRLRSVILDLPEAVSQAAGLLDADDLGPDRISYRAGNALEDDLGESCWDLVLLSQLAHHFDPRQNFELAHRVARALKPGGLFIIQDLVRPTTKKELKRLGGGALLDLYFAVTSRAGTYTIDDMRGWIVDAGLKPRRPQWLTTLGGAVQVIGEKV